MHDACLEADLDVLPHGDMTEVGERVRKRLTRSRVSLMTNEHDAVAGHLTFWWPEATC